jgi:PTS system fructose-specific IIC component
MAVSTLCELVEPALVKDIQTRTKREALNEIIDLLGTSPKVTHLESVRQAILAREELRSTGIGLSVAIPRAKVAAVSDYVTAIGRCPAGIQYDSPDGQPVQLIFAVTAPVGQAIGFVHLLARIAALVRTRALRIGLLEAGSPEDFCRILREADAGYGR